MWRIAHHPSLPLISQLWPITHYVACTAFSTKSGVALYHDFAQTGPVWAPKLQWMCLGYGQAGDQVDRGMNGGLWGSTGHDFVPKRFFQRHNSKMRQRGRLQVRRNLRPEGKSPEDLAAEDEEEYFVPETPYKTLSGDAIKASFLDFPAVEDQKLLQVGLLGVPNAGKSELTNRLVGNKVTATSNKENTTVNTAVGVFSVGNTQVVLYDLPGVLHPDDARYVGQLARVKGAWATASICDYILFLVDSHLHIKLLDRNVANKRLEKIFAKLKIGLDENGQPKDYPPVILVLNKADKVPDRSRLEELAKAFYQEYPFKKCFLVSALRGGGMQYLKEYLVRKATPREWTFPPGVITDKDPVNLALELVREKLYRRMNKELPYQIQPVHEAWREMPDGTANIKQIIYVKSDRVRRMLVGKKGEIIQSYISFRARRDLVKILGRKVNLSIKVRVENPLGKLAAQGK